MVSPLGQFMRDRNYTQGKLAAAAGVTQGRVGMLVRCEAPLSGKVREMLLEIAPEVVVAHDQHFNTVRALLREELAA